MGLAQAPGCPHGCNKWGLMGATFELSGETPRVSLNARAPCGRGEEERGGQGREGQIHRAQDPGCCFMAGGVLGRSQRVAARTVMGAGLAPRAAH